MNEVIEQRLLAKLKTLSPPQVAQVEDFVEFLAMKAERQAAFGRLLVIAPALEVAGAEPVSENELVAEIKAARQARNARSGEDAPLHAGRP